MAASSPLGGNDAFENVLRQEANSIEERARALEEKAAAQNTRAQDRMAELLSQNSTLPVTLSSIQVHGATHTRKSFLDPILHPLVSDSRNANYTLADMLAGVSSAVDKLRQFDIFQPNIEFYMAKPDPTNPSSSPTDLDISLRVREKSRLLLKTGTDLGNTEGSAYGNLQWRNIFGGAESLSLNASLGTRTRSAYSAEFSTPIPGLTNRPDLRFSLEGIASSTQKPWASHEEVVKGGAARVSWLGDSGDRYQVGYTGAWRQITGLGSGASPTVRADAGDSVKKALTWLYVRDRRDNPMLPQAGYLIKSASELAGWGALGGDVSFYKNEMEVAAAHPLPLGCSIGAGFRTGFLYPLPLGFGISGASPSRLNDRFTLGGPTDVRGFKLGGLGPRDGSDAVGGDVFAAGSVNLLIPLPRVGVESPFRLQVFANGGRLVAMKSYKHKEKQLEDEFVHAVEGREDLHSKTVWNGMTSALGDLVNGLPSMAAGVGLVYAHPVARFEVNFSLPLALRRGEEGRKGLSVGVGINFL